MLSQAISRCFLVTLNIISLPFELIPTFLGKPPYQRMTSVSPLPSYMSGYLHQLGRHASGVYRFNSAEGPFGQRNSTNICSYVSLPRTVETKRPIITNSPDSFISQKNISNGDINHNRINIKVCKKKVFLKRYWLLSQRISSNKEDYIRRKDKIKSRITNQRAKNIAQNRSKNIRSQKIIQNTRKVVPTCEASKILQIQKRNVPLKSLPLFSGSSNNYQIEEWTEKLLEEARWV